MVLTALVQTSWKCTEVLMWYPSEFFSYLVPFGAAQEQWWYFPLKMENFVNTMITWCLGTLLCWYKCLQFSSFLGNNNVHFRVKYILRTGYLTLIVMVLCDTDNYHSVFSGDVTWNDSTTSSWVSLTHLDGIKPWPHFCSCWNRM